MPAYGVDDLLNTSVYDFNRLKISVLEDKIEKINTEISIAEKVDEALLKKRITSATDLIYKHSKTAKGLGWVPGVNFVSFQAIYPKVIADIHRVMGISVDSEAVSEIVAISLAMTVAAPLMLIPGLNSYLQSEMIYDEGVKYLDTVVSVVRNSDSQELKNSKLMSKRINDEINKRKRR